MKIQLQYFFISLIFIVQGCSESKEDINSRNELSSTIRQLNSIYRDIKDNKSAEEQLNLLKTRDYYAEYTKQLRDLRQNMVGITVTDKFIPIRNIADSVISQSIEYINLRQAFMLKLFEVSSNMSSFKSYASSARDFENNDYGYKYVLEYKLKALEENKDFIVNKMCMFFMFGEKDSLSKRILFFSDSLNTLSKQMKFTDTISIHPIIKDTTDLIYTAWANIKDYEFPKLK